MITEKDFARIKNDVNGNPRYVIHFLSCRPKYWDSQPLAASYAATCKLMNKIGGKKFHNKQYGGGIVFQSYSLPATIAAIERAIAEVDGPRKEQSENDRRISIAKKAIESMPEFDTWESNIIDLIANLLHLAESLELDAEAIARIAYNHFEEETK